MGWRVWTAAKTFPRGTGGEPHRNRILGGLGGGPTKARMHFFFFQSSTNKKAPH